MKKIFMIVFVAIVLYTGHLMVMEAGQLGSALADHSRYEISEVSR